MRLTDSARPAWRPSRCSSRPCWLRPSRSAGFGTGWRGFLLAAAVELRQVGGGRGRLGALVPGGADHDRRDPRGDDPRLVAQGRDALSSRRARSPAGSGHARAAERMRSFERLKAALCSYAAGHDGRFPDAAEPSIAASLWEAPGGAGLHYLYVPGLSLRDPSAVLAYEPPIYGDERLVLRSSGDSGHDGDGRDRQTTAEVKETRR